MLGIFLDLETNGLDHRWHRILEIALQIVNLQSGKQVAHYSSVISHSPEIWKKSNPKSLEVNGFSWEELSQGNPQAVVQQRILELFQRERIQRQNSVFICQNPSFDRPFFAQLFAPEMQEEQGWPYHWLDLASMHWAIQMRFAKNQLELPWNTGFTKDQIAKYYQLPAEPFPHRAMGGVAHLIACYQKLVGFPE